MKELRCLVFSEQEVVAAVADRRKRLHENLGEGPIQKVTYNTENGVSVVLHTVNARGQEQTTVIQEGEISAALVNLCMSHKIPMPVNSEKYLQVINEGLTLMITLRFNKAHKSNNPNG